MKKYSFRKFINDLHLWLGIGSGLILFVVCLSGTIYTFRSEVEALLEPHKYKVAAVAGAERLSPEEVMQTIVEQVGGKVAYLEIPQNREQPYLLSIKKSKEERRGMVHYVNPYTAALLGTAPGPATDFFMTVFKLHRWLLLDTEIGRPIVGVATLIFVFMLLSGLVLWWPKKLKQWKQGFKVKTSGNWKRLNHDLHNTLGFYAALLLLVMALTGLCWSFDWYKEGLGTVIGTEVFGGRGGKPAEAAPAATEMEPIPYNSLMAQADQAFAYEGIYRIVPADSVIPVVVLSKYKTGFLASAGADQLHVHQYTGEQLRIERFSDKPLNQQIAASIKPLHTGEILGTFSKILYFIACLIGTSLPVTGTIIWLNKLKKKNAKNKQHKTTFAA